MVWGFYTGLAGQLVQKIIPPVEIAQIEKPKDVDKPPPPPPKLEEIKPYVPPPEFVDIQAAPPENNAISVVTQQKAPPPAPVVAAPVQHTITPPRYDPRHPFRIGDENYPDASRRAGEEGSCILMMKVSANGADRGCDNSNQYRSSALGRSLPEGRERPEDGPGHGRRQACGREFPIQNHLEVDGQVAVARSTTLVLAHTITIINKLF